MIDILLVEDNPGDVFLVEEALAQLNFDARLRVVVDGQQAMDLLHQGVARVDLVILDLNLPVKSGHEVLAEMNADLRLRRMPVAILTTSTSEEDAALQQSKENCLFFAKTPDMNQLLRIMREIYSFALWAA